MDDYEFLKRQKDELDRACPFCGDMRRPNTDVGPTDPGSVFTITYFHPKGPRGSLQPGDSLKLKTGMSITCLQTNRA